VPQDLRCRRAEAVPSGGCECTPRIDGHTSAGRPINKGDGRPCGNTPRIPLRTRQPAKPSKHGGPSDSCSEPKLLTRESWPSRECNNSAAGHSVAESESGVRAAESICTLIASVISSQKDAPTLTVYPLHTPLAAADTSTILGPSFRQVVQNARNESPQVSCIYAVPVTGIHNCHQCCRSILTHVSGIYYCRSTMDLEFTRHRKELRLSQSALARRRAHQQQRMKRC